jgi:hypothetical protein
MHARAVPDVLCIQDETLITLGVIDLNVYDTSIVGPPEPFVSFTAHRSFVRLPLSLRQDLMLLTVLVLTSLQLRNPLSSFNSFPKQRQSLMSKFGDEQLQGRSPN